jgi:hypothetical protein
MNERVYLVPVYAVGVTSARLRLDEAKNKQSRRVRWAAAFEFDGSIPR